MSAGDDLRHPYYAHQEQQKWGHDKRGWYIRLPQELPHERRIIDLETRVANLEVVLAKMEESK